MAVVAVAAFPPMLRLATGVVEVTVNGAVPVDTFDTSTGEVMLPPVKVKLVPVATPKAGVVRVGLVSVLFVNVSVPVKVASVPVFGSVTIPPEAVGFALIVVVPLVLPATTNLPTSPAAPKVLTPLKV